MKSTPRRWIPGLFACGVVGVASLDAASLTRHGDSHTFEIAAAEAPSAEVIADDVANPVAPRESALRADVRVRAFLQAYGALVDSVTYRDDDLVFLLAGKAIHFQDGRMLAEGGLNRRHRCDPIFYRYPLEMPTEPPPLPDGPVRFCTDVQEALWGRSESEIRKHARSTRFIERRIFVNDVVADALQKVERDILAVAEYDPEVASWIDETETAFSFVDRGIAGTATRSQHAWGLALDLVPASYDRQQVYWRWTRAWSPRSWHRTPLEQRWSPPVRVIEIFERHGFLWGGKWAHFDNIHFEYRPEILAYNRLLQTNSQ